MCSRGRPYGLFVPNLAISPAGGTFIEGAGHTACFGTGCGPWSLAVFAHSKIGSQEPFVQVPGTMPNFL